MLQSTADKIIDPDLDNLLGTNRGQYDSKGRCHWFGFGKVTLPEAVAEAVGRRGR